MCRAQLEWTLEFVSCSSLMSSETWVNSWVELCSNSLSSSTWVNSWVEFRSSPLLSNSRENSLFLKFFAPRPVSSCNPTQISTMKRLFEAVCMCLCGNLYNSTIVTYPFWLIQQTYFCIKATFSLKTLHQNLYFFVACKKCYQGIGHEYDTTYTRLDKFALWALKDITN